MHDLSGCYLTGNANADGNDGAGYPPTLPVESTHALTAFPGMHIPTEDSAVTDPLIKTDPGILGGTPVFTDTRVPVRILMEYLEAGDRLDEFLDHFPTVSRKQAVQVLERATALLVGHTPKAAA